MHATVRAGGHGKSFDPSYQIKYIAIPGNSESDIEYITIYEEETECHL